MKLEFVGGSRDGGFVDFPSPMFDEYLKAPIFFEEVTDDNRETGPIKVGQEVYRMTEPGKLLFQGWNE